MTRFARLARRLGGIKEPSEEEALALAVARLGRYLRSAAPKAGDFSRGEPSAEELEILEALEAGDWERASEARKRWLLAPRGMESGPMPDPLLAEFARRRPKDGVMALAALERSGGVDPGKASQIAVYAAMSLPRAGWRGPGEPSRAARERVAKRAKEMALWGMAAGDEGFADGMRRAAERLEGFLPDALWLETVRAGAAAAEGERIARAVEGAKREGKREML